MAMEFLQEQELVDHREFAFVDGIECGLDKLLGLTTPNTPGPMFAVERTASESDEEEIDRSTLR